MTWRNIIRYRRAPELLIFSTISPVMFVLLFNYVFGGAIPTGDLAYIDFLMPGILIQTTISAPRRPAPDSPRTSRKGWSTAIDRCLWPAPPSSAEGS